MKICWKEARKTPDFDGIRARHSQSFLAFLPIEL